MNTESFSPASAAYSVSSFFQNPFSPKDWRIHIFGDISVIPDELVATNIVQSALVVLFLLWYLYHFYNSDEQHPDIATRAYLLARKAFTEYSILIRNRFNNRNKKKPSSKRR